jgi:hypothetical protein
MREYIVHHRVNHCNFAFLQSTPWYRGKTIVLNSASIDLTWLANLYLRGESVAVQVELGVATCHPTDQFNKKLGVKIAKERMKIMNLPVSSLTSSESTTRVTLDVDDNTQLIYIQYKDSKRHHFMIRLNSGVKGD